MHRSLTLDLAARRAVENATLLTGYRSVKGDHGDSLEVRIVRGQRGDRGPLHDRDEEGVVGEEPILALDLVALLDILQSYCHHLDAYLDDLPGRGLMGSEGLRFVGVFSGKVVIDSTLGCLRLATERDGPKGSQGVPAHPERSNPGTPWTALIKVSCTFAKRSRGTNPARQPLSRRISHLSAKRCPVPFPDRKATVMRGAWGAGGGCASIAWR